MTDRQGSILGLASARGGVGRAMTVANVGALLAQKGKRVLVVDLAVDEPALDRYFHGRGGEGRTGGLVDFFARVRAAPGALPRAFEAPEQAAARVAIAEELDAEPGIQVIPLRLGGAGFELHYWPAEGVRATGHRGRVLEEAPWIFAPLASALRARYDEVLLNLPSGRTEVTGIVAAHAMDKLVLVVDDASLEEVVELGRFAHSRRELVDASKPLSLFPLLVRVEPGEGGRSFVAEAKEQLEGLFYETTGVLGRDLGPYLALAAIPWSERVAQRALIAAEIESTADPTTLSHAYLRFVQCLRRQSPFDVGEAARPSSRDLWAAIEARRGRSSGDSIPPSDGRPPSSRVPPPSSKLVSDKRPSSPSSVRVPESVRVALPEHGEIGRLEDGEIIRRYFARRFEDPEFFTEVLFASYRRGKARACRGEWAEACKDLGMALELCEEKRLVSEPAWLSAVVADAALTLGHCCIELDWDETAANHFAMARAAATGRAGSGYRSVLAASLCGSAFSLGRMGASARALEAAGELLSRAGPSDRAPTPGFAAITAANAAMSLAHAGRSEQAASILVALCERLSGVSESPFFEVAAAATCNAVTVLHLAGRHEEADAWMEVARARFGGSLRPPVVSALSVAECSRAEALAARGRGREAVLGLVSLGERLSRICLWIDAEPWSMSLLAWASYSLSRALAREGRVDEARAALGAAVGKVRPDDPRRSWILGQAALDLLRISAMAERFGVAVGELGLEVVKKYLLDAAEARGAEPYLLSCAGIVTLLRVDAAEAAQLLARAHARGGASALERSLSAIRSAMDPEGGAFVRKLAERADTIAAERREALVAGDPTGLSLLLTLAGAPRGEAAIQGAREGEAGGLGLASTPAVPMQSGPVRPVEPLSSMSTEPPLPAMSCRLLLLERRFDLPEDRAGNPWEGPELFLSAAVPAPVSHALSGVLLSVVSAYSAGRGFRLLLRGARTCAGLVKASSLVLDVGRGEGGERFLRIFDREPGDEVSIASEETLVHVRRGHCVGRMQMDDTPWVAVWRLLWEGLGGAYDISLSEDVTGVPFMIVTATPRISRAGCTRVSAYIDPVLAAQEDPGAIRRVVIRDQNGCEDVFVVEGASRIRLSAADFIIPTRTPEDVLDS